MNHTARQFSVFGIAAAMAISTLVCARIPVVSAPSGHHGHEHGQPVSVDHVDHAHSLSLAVMPALVTCLILAAAAWVILAVYRFDATFTHSERPVRVTSVADSPPPLFRRVISPSSPRSPPLR